MKKLMYKYAGKYENEEYKNLAKLVKTGDDYAISIAADTLKGILPPKATLVPIPSHTGRATYTFKICCLLARRYGYGVADCLASMAHESLCTLKREGRPLPSPEDLKFRLRYIPVNAYNICLIDNVIATGTTAMAAASLFEDVALYCIASDENYQKIPNIKKLK